VKTFFEPSSIVFVLGAFEFPEEFEERANLFKLFSRFLQNVKNTVPFLSACMSKERILIDTLDFLIKELKFFFEHQKTIEHTHKNRFQKELKFSRSQF
jgi:hypothetical protein